MRSSFLVISLGIKGGFVFCVWNECSASIRIPNASAQRRLENSHLLFCLDHEILLAITKNII